MDDVEKFWKALALVFITLFVFSFVGLFISTKPPRCGSELHGYYKNDIENLGNKICELKGEGCKYSGFEDVCNTGKAVDKLICDCNPRDDYIKEVLI